MPKVDQIDHRLGPLVQEFKDLVYPADYNPETKSAPKRKIGELLSFQGFGLVTSVLILQWVAKMIRLYIFILLRYNLKLIQIFNVNISDGHT